jgi:hypothetical protein
MELFGEISFHKFLILSQLNQYLVFNSYLLKISCPILMTYYLISCSKCIKTISHLKWFKTTSYRKSESVYVHPLVRQGSNFVLRICVAYDFDVSIG